MRVSPLEQPLTLAEYMSLDSAGKKKNLFIRVLDRLKVTEETLKQAQAKILEANQKLEAANAKAFAGNHELSTALEQAQSCKESYLDIMDKNRRLASNNERLSFQISELKSKWYFKLFGKWSM